MVLLLSPFVLAACGKGFVSSEASGGDNSSSSFLGGGGGTGTLNWSDEKVALDSYGESFSKSIATQLKNSHYMEKNCVSDFSFADYGDLPVQRCSYTLNGQKAQVAMLNPGPRRLTAWLIEACSALSSNLQNCVQKSYNQILNQSGAQFPISGIVIEDMDGNGAGNAYAFREGVTVRVPSFGTGTESLVTSSQIAASFTDDPMYAYGYGRPISVTRPQLQTYASSVGLNIPNLGTSDQRLNIFYVVIGQLYRDSWVTGRSDIVRAWVKAQGL